MLKTLGGLVVIGAIVFTVGFLRGWFTVDRRDELDHPRVAVGLDREQMERDSLATRKAFDDAMESIQQKIDRLRGRAPPPTATPPTNEDEVERARAQQQELAEFERQRDALARKLDELKTATGARYDELKREIRETLDRMIESLDRALK